jgi:hypothetical protein
MSSGYTFTSTCLPILMSKNQLVKYKYMTCNNETQYRQFHWLEEHVLENKTCTLFIPVI